MKSKLILLLLFEVAFKMYAQFPENTYPSSNNQYYWKNRKPYEGYWQQDVIIPLKQL